MVGRYVPVTAAANTAVVRDVFDYTGATPLKLMPCRRGNRRQLWKREMNEEYIRSGVNRNNVLDIYGQSFTFTMLLIQLLPSPLPSTYSVCLSFALN